MRTPIETRLYDGTEVQPFEATGPKGGPLTHLEGRAVPYDVYGNVAGLYLERMAFGALDASTSKGAASKGLPLLLWHDRRNWPIGLSREWQSRADGLWGVWSLDDSADAQRAAALARSGEMGWMSIGFTPIRQEWEQVGDWNPDLGPAHLDRVTRLEARLNEVSLVSTPVFADAEVSLVRTADRRNSPTPDTFPGVEGWRRELDRLRG